MIPAPDWLPASFFFILASSGALGIYLRHRRGGSEVDDSEPLAKRLIANSNLPPRMRELQQELRSAGLYEPDATTEYTNIRAIAGLGILAATALTMFLVQDQFAGYVFLVGLLLAGAAYSLPRLVLSVWRRRQTRAIERDLPLAIDLHALCLSAGQDLVAGLRKTSEQLQKSSPVLSRELAIVCRHAELRSLEHALRQWMDRVQSPEVSNLAMLLMQSERLGTDSAATLHELATSYRVNSRQRAEAQANRTSFWLLFPTIFCFWIAAAIILIGPTYMEFFRHHQRSGALLNQPAETLQSITGNATNQVIPANNPGAGSK